jgi:hypothetical protein
MRLRTVGLILSLAVLMSAPPGQAQQVAKLYRVALVFAGSPLAQMIPQSLLLQADHVTRE